MGKSASYICTSCGAKHARWNGQCDVCKEWNTIIREAPLSAGPTSRSLGGRRGNSIDLTSLSSIEDPPERNLTGMTELDRVLGGGLALASATLVGGDPGIGKSTLLLQAAAHCARNEKNVIYVSGEEASSQIRLRASRLGLGNASVRLANATSLRDILATLDAERPDLVIIDSIQTIWLDNIEAAPGSLSQVRASAHELVDFAKRKCISAVLVGHVTKEGLIAGPRVVEHMVDTVLYFEGERGHQFRILRSVKNRYGPIDEIGIFEMTAIGLEEVSNPSELFLSGRAKPAPGSVVFAGMEGSRPLLVEIQALVARSPLSQPRRTVLGLDQARLAMILAVLESRCGISFAGLDVFLNVAGGLKITDPSADLAVAAALMSARDGKSLEADTVVFGEISLSGALRPVPQVEKRLKESKKLGFTCLHIPADGKRSDIKGITVEKHGDLGGFVAGKFEER
ncbi:MAG: DNA repair protein RadA [Roseovarius sp.]|nr:DNA repair protein RadA [Roseovarius sp.]